MSNEEMKLAAELRSDSEQGSRASGRLRRAGLIPGAVNRIEGGTTLVKFNAHAFNLAMRKHASEHVLVSLELDAKVVPALIREVQHDVLTGAPIHVDFGEISLTKKIRVSIPVHLMGEAEGVKIGGGVLEHMLRAVEVDCLPTDIVERFDVDVSGLKLAQTLFVRDLRLGDAYTVVTSKDLPVASVVNVAEEATAAEGEATPEVIAKGKKEEAGAAPAKK
ncbi:MAG: 50S ribosomal protein L25 [Kiritimatiellaeota bacterium]|nr:50S ribosomal protein L25 [Kiritimatiellota bacterium]